MKFMVWRGAVVAAGSIAGDYNPKVRDDDTTQPFDGILIKALDCAGDDYPVWQGHYDARAPHSADELGEQLLSYRAQGIDAVPWGVARGTFAYDEGVMAGTAAARDPQGRFCLDLEPYDLFWRHSTPQRVREFLQGFKNGGGRELWLSTDSRGTKPMEVDMPTWLEDSIVTRLMPQAYWTDFQTDWKTGINASYLPLMALGVAESRIYPTYPLDASYEDLKAAIEYAQSPPAFGGVDFWRRGIAPQGVLDALAALPEPVYAAPSAPPPPVADPPPPPAGGSLQQAWEDGYRAALLTYQARIAAELDGLGK